MALGLAIMAEHACRSQQVFTVKGTENRIAVHLLQTTREHAVRIGVFFFKTRTEGHRRKLQSA